MILVLSGEGVNVEVLAPVARVGAAHSPALVPIILTRVSRLVFGMFAWMLKTYTCAGLSAATSAAAKSSCSVGVAVGPETIKLL